MRKPEKFLSPKELSLALEESGVHTLSPKYCRLLVAAIREDWGVGSGILLGTHIRLSVALGWLLTHPEWRPRARAARAVTGRSGGASSLEYSPRAR